MSKQLSMTGGSKFKILSQRMTLFFLALVLTFGLFEPGMTYALQGSSKKTEFNLDYKLAPLPSEKSADKRTVVADDIGVNQELALPKVDNPKGHRTEEASKRTEFTSTYINNDGTRTLEWTPHQQNYKKDGKWQKLSDRLRPEKKQKPEANLWQKITGSEPQAEAPSKFKVDAGNLKSEFKPLAEGLTINVEKKTFTITPEDAKNVTPEQLDDRSVIYRNAWKDTDIIYEMRGESIKEIIVVKSKNAKANYTFNVKGANVIAHPSRSGELAIEGLPEDYSFSALTLDLQGRGVISEDRVTQKPGKDSRSIEIIMDEAWLKKQPASSFPMHIDPSFQRVAASFWMYKSDGYSCNGSNCYANIGTLNDAGRWQHWRTYVQFPYGDMAGKKILSANMNGRFKYGKNGITDGRWIAMGHANCLGFWCQGYEIASAHVGTDFNLNFTSELQNTVSSGNFGAVWSFWGEEGGNKSFKPYSDLIATVNYDTPTPVAQPTEPSNGQVTPATQPTLKVNAVSDADGDAVKYYFRVSTNSSAEGGAVINSGWITTPQWTVPDGILQDGTTYYWHTYTMGATQTNPTWVRSFKIDQRTGKDNTQTFDTIGPVEVNLATGNVVVENTSHTMDALGGSIGVGLNYNTPQRAKKGLKAEYWNIPSTRTFADGTPTGTPSLTRTDPDINFSWGNANPGTNIGADYWYARWTGKMVVPHTGSYIFGAAADDEYAVYINGSKIAGAGCCGVTAGYGSSTFVTLTAGQIIDLRVEYRDATYGAHMKLYVKGAVDEQIVPREWLFSEDADGSKLYGLTGRYYTDNSGAHDIDNAAKDPMRLMFMRQDTKMSLDFGTSAPIPGMQADSFMARWTGYITAPTAGEYQLGVTSDDGVRVKLNNGLFGAQTTPIDKWSGVTGLAWSGSIRLEAGKQIPITVDWYELGGPAYLKLFVQGNGIQAQEIPVSWLTPKANAVPEGWQLSVDVDGDIAYERLRVSGTSIILEDSTRQAHTYTAVSGGGYKPPVDEDGVLIKNSDGTFTLTDADGRVYAFNTDGTLKSVTTPTDDRKPAALKYSYGTDQNGGGIPRLLRIEDGVNTARNATLHYKGVQDENMCGYPSGFDAAPDGMLCAIKTSDGDETRFYYKNGQLARIARPGNDLTDYQYNASGQIIAIRDSLASDAIAAGVRSNDETVTTQLSYDEIGRISSIKAPAPTSGANRLEHTFKYLPDPTSLAGATEMHITGAPEPNGYSKRVGYDALLRSTKVTDLSGKTEQTEWDTVKDVQLSTTDATGLKSTTIYDQSDQPIDNYGPAPADWFGSDRRPIAARVDQVPRTSTRYDDNMKGPAVSWYRLKGANMALIGAPIAHTTGFSSNQAPESGNPAYLRHVFGGQDLPFGSTSEPGVTGYGFIATGKFTAPQNGTYIFTMHSDDSTTLQIDDITIFNNWGTKTADGVTNQLTGTFVAVAGKEYRFQLRYGYDGAKKGTMGLAVKGPGIPDTLGNGAGTRDWSAYLKPGYNLQTSTTAYDSIAGNTTTTTRYANPAYGTVASTALDPGGLNYVSQATYEAPGSGFLRQTSKTLPGGGTITYQHYSTTDTRDNPCTPEIEAFRQAGRSKGKIEADPDGAGPLMGRSSETIYNESGDVVATRYNSEPWTCTNYDVRGRVTETITPAVDGKPGRTVTNSYAYNGNPLVTSTSDASGTIIVENDLLGRTVKYTDAKGNETTNTYDTFGKLTQRVSEIGTESYEYDNYDRLTVQKLDSVTFATVTYDEFSRLATVQYPAGISLSSITRDTLGRENGTTFTVNSQDYTDSIERFTSGDIKQGTENGTAKTYQYDSAGRLVGATVGGNTFTYEFGAPDASCSGIAGNNPNTAKNGNRTKMTINGTSTTYCYDMADRLISSSDPTLTDAQYDSRGNTVSLGDTTHKTEFSYDANDRNTKIKFGSKETLFARDTQDRIISREHKENGATTSSVTYGFTGSGDTPDFLQDSAGNVKQKYLMLPGDVIVTIKPDSTSAGATTYSLPNIHGDVYLTVDADGQVKSTHQTGPFGEQLPGQAAPQNTADGTTWNYVGQHQKLTDTDTSPVASGIMQMGARVYIPALGRFLQVDPIEGGGDNAYVYVNDPVSEDDLDGKIAPLVAFAVWQLGRIAVQQTVKYAVKQAATQAVKRVAKKAVVHSTKKVVQKAAPKRIVIGAHARQQMQARGVTRAMVNKAVQKGTAYIDRRHTGINAYVLRNGMASGKSLYAAQNRLTGKITTVMIRKKFNPRTGRWIPY